jgi:hypothetical protein
MAIQATKMTAEQAIKFVDQTIEGLDLTKAQKADLREEVGRLSQNRGFGHAVLDAIQKVERGYIAGADKHVMGNLGAFLAGASLVGASGTATWLAGKEGIESVETLVKTWKEQDTFMRGIWNSIPDAFAVGGWTVLTAAMAALTIASGANYLDHMREKYGKAEA